MRASLALLSQDRNLSLFIAARILLLVTLAARPFYTVYAKDRLGAPVAMAGVYLGALRAAGVASTLLWGRLRDRLGGRRVMLGVSLLTIPLTLAPLLIGTRLSYWWFAVLFALQGVVISGTDIYAQTLILDLAPPGLRVMSVGLANTVFGVASLAMAGAGFVAEQWGLEAIFALCGVVAVVAPFLVLRLRDPLLQPSGELGPIDSPVPEEGSHEPTET